MPSDNDNHANQMNPNNDAYWESRGHDERPDNWEDEAEMVMGATTITAPTSRIPTMMRTRLRGGRNSPVRSGVLPCG